MSPVAVTLVHWGFAVFGGACCLTFIVTPPALKPPLPFVTLLPQGMWVCYVVHLARKAGLRRWG
jgi:UDP-GlcNAc:undecaprenyl-phosphate GlcNAc-1-phosphate transferase